MRILSSSSRRMAVNGLELFGLFAVSGLISLLFPRWVPLATANPLQREWASVFSAGSLLACVVSLRAFATLTKAYAHRPEEWRTWRGPFLKWMSMAVDAMAFFWSTRACTDRDTVAATIAMAVLYIAFPRFMKLGIKLAEKRAAPPDASVASDVDGPLYGRVVAGAALVGLVCLLISCAITEL